MFTTKHKISQYALNTKMDMNNLIDALKRYNNIVSNCDEKYKPDDIDFNDFNEFMKELIKFLNDKIESLTWFHDRIMNSKYNQYDDLMIL